MCAVLILPHNSATASQTAWRISIAPTHRVSAPTRNFSNKPLSASRESAMQLIHSVSALFIHCWESFSFFHPLLFTLPFSGPIRFVPLATSFLEQAILSGTILSRADTYTRNVGYKATKSLTDTACGRPHRDKTSIFVALNIAMGSITCFVILVRLGFKWKKRRIGIDDWIVFAALILLVPLIVLKVRGLAYHGLGRDVWTLERETLTHFMISFYIDELFYITIIALIKTAISFFYLSIFRFTCIRLILWAIIVFNAAFGIGSLLAIAFQCSPVSYYWTFIAEPGTGKCFNSQAAAWAHGAISIAINLCLIALALGQVIGLELHWKKKIGVIFMFSVGGL